MQSPAQLPLVSVIIPTKNAAEHVAQAIESVVAQAYPSCEILVVDGHSTDATARIVKTFPTVQFITQSGAGLSDGWNCGIAAAAGELITFLDSDDHYPPGRLAGQARFMVEHPEVDYTLVQTHHVHAPGEQLPERYRRAGMEADVGALIPGATMVRRALFDRVGLFDTSLVICGDIDWFFRAKDMGARLVHLPEVGLVKQTRGESLSLAPANGTLFRRELVGVMRRSIVRQRSTQPVVSSG